ncbi:hypothetical protein T03_4632 [Trichinella britovi]|uniref:Uncharacterized protein n=1 Tax=Trichinella britovi TaxID=45882 RepID=A0A0V1AV60_TRIBR|nr:hypothetical protein T03_4632 [Trichinella britovi]
MKDTFVANQNAYLEMVLQQMTERVLQTISRFMARQGRPPQWNYEEKRNVWSLATSRRHCEEREQLSTSNPTLKYDETHSVVKNHGVLRLI